ncbi:MAG: hypothetical protein A2504_07325 [Bdellovibrionales bacterium RIFOXYD12_FULL_39_22]|nr:MAG: hypothetical protein A2385_16695 [Bdellovibrionales bacterium RIFOXYB1_FULL_39_21]OFZ44689.1 MAG: hypothetical protein A2485_14555 [Bdellovibrionales bacterium RIFOXYC12_FULL_39_17]OFZ49319.1 MAG: hypothetical protein A2404_08850 [Bdellovibrionales bacterium RIFOXYC1_FULL_39_130]OFZ77055.1 MAG: hypothetical protein A2560_09815 [Bdellovibrionales bacterium RIFOXYD1_FULL_39_84]OFZ95315.1 MAG: hypothetical protein A2504_07325 [Bdellovibrionales bacterium RIFOXYD12_FULL_39_22]HLE13069.1 NA
MINVSWAINTTIHLLILIICPIFVIGIINRVKSIWSGRKGPNLNQSFFDLYRLLKKRSVYSENSSWIFQLAPAIILATALLASLLSPIVPGVAPISFKYDFVYFVYLLGLGRIFIILAALDTGSSFEGMGAGREATYSAYIEPALFFSIGTLGIISGNSSFESLVVVQASGLLIWIIKFLLFFSLFILLQIEAARVPVDDPNTHLELTMIHEVMILDTSGPELAMIQYGSALKLVSLAGLIAALLNPFLLQNGKIGGTLFYFSWITSLLIIVAISILIGLIESWVPRFKMRFIPAYALMAVLAGLIAMLLASLGKAGMI